MLDADIILFEPTLGSTSSDSEYIGQPVLNEYHSFNVKKNLDHWRSEILAACRAGKLVIIYLARPVTCFRYTGHKSYSGTGRNARVTTNVEPVSSYDAVPGVAKTTAKSGSEIAIDKDAKFLAAYWFEFGVNAQYEAVIEGEFKNVLLRAPAGSRTLGATAHVTSATGTLLFLPPLLYTDKTFTRYNKEKKQSFWTPKAIEFGKRLLAALGSLITSLSKSAQLTPPPTWVMESRYRLELEGRIEAQIVEKSAAMSSLQAKRASLEQNLLDAGSLRQLLFEQGTQLELVILEVLRLFKFQAESFDDGKSEFDSVFVSPEGRCLGEAEGKDTKAVNIDKITQLERNLNEDFEREEINDYAKGVLFGNAFRLTPVDERGNFFTEKCESAGKRLDIALVRTPDLFAPAKYLKEHPEDEDFAKRCREAIFASNGTIVVFPDVPISEPVVIGAESDDGPGAETK